MKTDNIGSKHDNLIICLFDNLLALGNHFFRRRRIFEFPTPFLGGKFQKQ